MLDISIYVLSVSKWKKNATYDTVVPQEPDRELGDLVPTLRCCDSAEGTALFDKGSFVGGKVLPERSLRYYKMGQVKRRGVIGLHLSEPLHLFKHI
jgi:hypothetical protein